jgi:hypothetical protein
MSWNKAPKEAEACKDFAERALKRIAELDGEVARLEIVVTRKASGLDECRKQLAEAQAQNKRIAELELLIDEKETAIIAYKEKNAELEAENKRLRLALKRIAPTACPKCGDRAVQQIARDALRDIDAEMEGEISEDERDRLRAEIDATIVAAIDAAIDTALERNK